ncbi:hypothetical protein AtubIFM55763_001769 [Aspergillus tubingensis]|nr:hypothetical protein AtubIFM55763_001769 [Aspergillus tubingensis]
MPIFPGPSFLLLRVHQRLLQLAHRQEDASISCRTDLGFELMLQGQFIGYLDRHRRKVVEDGGTRSEEAVLVFLALPPPPLIFQSVGSERGRLLFAFCSRTRVVARTIVVPRADAIRWSIRVISDA